MQTSRRLLGLVALTGTLALTAATYHALADDPAPAGQGQEAQAANPLDKMGQQMLAALHATEGCLGTETAQTTSGKLVIFAWFENAEAARDWYHSRAHRGAMNIFMRGQAPQGEPLEFVEDEEAPVMVIASLTPADAEFVEQFRLPISQIAIEMYTPLPGGTAVNGRFAPAALAVPHLDNITMGPPPAGDR